MLQKIIRHLPVGLFAKDVTRDYRYMMWNETAEQLFHMPAESILGFTDWDVFAPEEADFFRKTDERVMRDGKVVEIAEESVTHGNRTWYAHTLKVPIYDAEGKPSILLAITEDITLKRESEANLQAKLAAERANEAKSEFLANMSHELRTPLNSIMGLTQLLKATRLTSEQREMLAVMHQASDLLLTTINDVLDISKIEARQMVLEEIAFDLPQAVKDAVIMLRPLAQQKGLKLLCHMPDEQMPEMLGDPVRLVRVLTNLIGNAIKYTHQGQVEVNLQWSEVTDGSVMVECSVTDTGIGIAPEKHALIFDQFSQADTSTTRKYGGTGLGLAITRQLVEMMGGTITVRSALDEGSCFTITIPMQPAHAKTHVTANNQHPQTLPTTLLKASQARVLVAEDNPLNQLFMEKMLEGFGFRNVTMAANGKLALDQYFAHDFDLLFLDCHMPEISGYDVARTIRDVEKDSGKHIPIVAMTANVLFDERDKCMEAGMDEYIGKPINIDLFRGMLNRWVQLESLPPSASAEPIDMHSIDNYAQGDRQSELHIVGLFMEQAQELLAVLEEHCVDGPCKPWFETAHLLKGSAANIGATALYELCGRAQEYVSESAECRIMVFQEIAAEVNRIGKYFAERGLLQVA